MYARTISRIMFALLVLGTLASCDRGVKPQAGKPSLGARKGISEVAEVAASSSVDGQTVYVPVYSQIPAGDRGYPFQLSVTLSVRNTDRSSPIVLTSVQYFGEDGQLVRDFVKKPLRIAPLAAAAYFIQERDASGGTAASFLVEWVADKIVSEPVIEAVMVGTAGNQGISFTAAGKTIARKAK